MVVVKENQKSLVRLKIVLDALMLFASFLIAYYLRFYTNLISEGIIVFSLWESILPIFVSLPIYLLIYQALDLYNTKRHFGIFEMSIRVFRSNVFGMLVIVLALYVLKVIDFSRWTLALFFVINSLMTSVSRIIFQSIWFHRAYDEKNAKRCLVIGYNDISRQMVDKLSVRKEWGYQVIGYLDEPKIDLDSALILGTIDTLENHLYSHSVDVVIIALNDADYMRLGDIIATCEKAGVKTQIVPYYYRYIPNKPYMDDLDGIPIIDTRHVPLDNFIKRAIKRSFDVLFSVTALILTAPILILAAFLTKVTSKGPVFYRQERVGLNRRPFMMLKFRSMVVQTEDDEKDKWTTQNDPRKTGWGSFMRKTSIDELPQFINVLKGDMSVVGPRPERPYFVEQFKDEIPKYMIKHQVRPGITGWAQVNGWRGDTSIHKRIECDLYYIENWKFSFDIKIVLLTVFKGFLNRNAY